MAAIVPTASERKADCWARKKYRKMMLDFDEKMEESSSLYDCQHKTVSLARRLQEQNEYVILLHRG